MHGVGSQCWSERVGLHLNLGAGATKQNSPPNGRAVCKVGLEADQRLENWNERRAFMRPYFLLSTIRLSRVRKPPGFKVLRSSGS
jgi:hypothetical protein